MVNILSGHGPGSLPRCGNILEGWQEASGIAQTPLVIGHHVVTLGTEYG